MQKNGRERTAQPLSFPHQKESQRAVLDSHQIPFSMPQHHYIRNCLYDNTDNFHVLIDNPNVFIEAFYESRQKTLLIYLPKYMEDNRGIVMGPYPHQLFIADTIESCCYNHACYPRAQATQGKYQNLIFLDIDPGPVQCDLIGTG